MPKAKEEKVKTLETFNVMNDYFFKSIFRSKEARGVIIKFLSAVTGIDVELLKKAKFSGGDVVKSNINERGQVSDLIVEMDELRKIIVEANNSSTNPNIFIKNSNYAFSIIVASTKPNDNYAQITLINIDNFNKFNSKEPILYFKLRDQENHIENENYNSIHLILENIINIEYNKNIKKEIIEFSKFLCMHDIKNMVEEYKGDSEYMKMVNKVEDFTKNPEFIGYYDLEEARQREIREVEQAGYDKGIEQGIASNKIEIAKNLLSINLPLEQISQVTNLPINEIESLSNTK